MKDYKIMKKVSIFNIKGGVAKTTSTANLGACLSQQGKKVFISRPRPSKQPYKAI